MSTHHRIIIGDSRNMEEVPSQSVHLVVTSPPYWQLKDYGSRDQIGFYDTYEEYINSLNLVWRECCRVLHDGCRLCVNIGDQYARSYYYGRYKVIPIRTEIIRFCEHLGFDYMGAIIWQKVTTCNTTGGGTVMGSYPYPRNGVLKLDYEFILIFRKQGSPPRVSARRKEQSRLTRQEWNTYFAGHWNFPGVKQGKNLAAFPEELPRRLMKMFSFAGDIVLDPFLGSGTSTLAACKLERNSIGYEICADFLPEIKKRLNIAQPHLFQNAGFEIIVRPVSPPALEEDLQKLPYVFRDPVQVAASGDPRTRTFGSRVSAEETQPQACFAVQDITSPVTLTLRNGVSVRLLGLKIKPGKEQEAVQYLREKTRGQKVFMKFDTDKPRYDDNSHVLCYLYLRNRTFLNAHLLKHGLAAVDRTCEHPYLNKFTASAAE